MNQRALELAAIYAGESNPRAELARALLEADERIKRLEEALLKIQQWSAAYPADVFPEQDLKRADKVLAEHGISMTAMHGQWGRHIAEGVGKIASAALERP